MDYRQAKDRINELSPFAFIRPDSFTRRGDVFIARRAFVPKDRNLIGLEWASSVKQLFPEARIIRTYVDRKYHARCWIQFKEIINE